MAKPNIPEQTLPIPSIGVGGILFNNQQQVLLIKRNQAPAKGLWSLPGGRLEPGETMIAACRREFYEETNLVVDIKHIVAIVDRQIEGFHYVIVDFFVQLLDDNNTTPIAQSDVADAKWISMAHLNSYPIVEGLVNIIMTAHKSHARGELVGLHDVSKGGTDFILP